MSVGPRRVKKAAVSMPGANCCGEAEGPRKARTAGAHEGSSSQLQLTQGGDKQHLPQINTPQRASGKLTWGGDFL